MLRKCPFKCLTSPVSLPKLLAIGNRSGLACEDAFEPQNRLLFIDID